MKKSKFLQSSKDMLSRSFNPSKCKTSLKLAASRMKLLRNKKEVQVKQMKREISQLLESGQEQTARIRVEHVIREEKMMAAYDLIHIYCELMVARLPIIDSQKNCPNDLKEAITSIVFASPRCGDVPELVDIRKQITAKYGKDFTTAAIELRPACGVSRMLVEKLSAAAPDGPTKIKILSAIAEEHNVKWEHKSFDEKDSVPLNDLPSGPSTIGSGSYAASSHFDSTDFPAPPSNKVNGSRYNFGSESKPNAESSHIDSANFQAPPNNNMHGSQFNPSREDIRTSVGPQNHAPAPSLSASTSFQPKETPPDIYTGRQDWTMEFKDATSAAQAAAESAERASMAARAAAELASGGRITRQSSNESRKSEAYVMKDDGPGSYVNAKVAKEHLTGDRMGRPSSGRTRLENEEIDGINANRLQTVGSVEEDGRGHKQVYSQSASQKSKASTDKDIWDQGVPAGDGFSWNNYSRDDSRGREGRLNEQSFRHGAESPKDPEKSESTSEEWIRKQPSVKSSRSHSSVSDEFKPEAESPNGWVEKSESISVERISKQPSVKSPRSHSNISDDVNIFASSELQKFGYDADDDPNAKEESIGEDSASVHFDKFDSDGDEHGFDYGGDHGFDFGPKYDDHESEFHLPSPSQKSTAHPLLNVDSWGPRSSSSKTVVSTSSLFFTRKDSSTEFSENFAPVNVAEKDNFKPVTFDDSDGPVSDSDEEINLSKRTSTRNSSDLLSRNNRSGKLKIDRGSSFEEKEYSRFDREGVSLSSDDEPESVIKTEMKSSYVDFPEKSSFKKSSMDQPAFGIKKSADHLAEEPDTVSGDGLNFGKLTGGFRHKGNRRPPFVKHQLDDKEETTSTSLGSNFRPAVESPYISNTHKNKIRIPEPVSDSDSDSSEEVTLRKRSGQKLETQELNTRKEATPRLSLGSSKLVFGSDDSDLDDDAPKKPISGRTPVRGGLSRRTKVSPTSGGASAYPKMRERSGALDSEAVGRKPTTSYISDTPKVEPQTEQQSYEQPAPTLLSRPARSYWGPPENPYSPKTSVMKQESKAHDDDAIGERKPRTSSPKTQKESAPAATKPSNSNSSRTPERVNSGKSTSVTGQDSKFSLKPSTAKPSSPSVSSEIPKAATHNKTSSKDEGTPKASHVHPKLPDYDFLVQSLRKNRS